MKNIESYRDLSLFKFDSHNLVIANDSSGAIGLKKYDIVKADPEIVGYFSARVCLTEVIAYGAEPILLINNLSVEMEPTGRRIIGGIKRAMSSIDMDLDKMLNGSSEENFKTEQTGIGITVIGYSKDRDIPVYRAKKKDLILALGRPYIGDEVIKNIEDIPEISEIKAMRNNPNINDILPVGSKGIREEIKNIERSLNSKAVIFETELDLNKSAGPATCILVTINYNDCGEFIKNIEIPVEVIGLL
ncbi:MAG: selenophosphate synthase [Tissierellia bacterium]|nr:selenophosphate synthase [Tissierellia bacterium]